MKIIEAGTGGSCHKTKPGRPNRPAMKGQLVRAAGDVFDELKGYWLLG